MSTPVPAAPRLRRELGSPFAVELRPHDGRRRARRARPAPRRDRWSGTGRTLEIGAGTGLNLSRYGAAVEALVLTEPFEPMARAAARQGRRAAGPAAEVIETPAELLPFDDDSFDTVVATLVLCTIPDPERALSEVARVLKPDGRLLFIEHVRQPRPQDWRVRRTSCTGPGTSSATAATTTATRSPRSAPRASRSTTAARRDRGGAADGAAARLGLGAAAGRGV